MLSFDVNFLTSSRRESGSPTSDELLAGFITGVPDALRTGEDSRSSLEENCEESFGGISANSGGDEVESPPRTTAVRHGAPAKKPQEKCKKATAEGKDAEKPGKSYIALISMAILSVPEKKLLLGDIYKFLTDKFAYYSYCDDNAWKNSIRHNLSLNECFVKNGRADNGKGNYWSIHAACLEDFKRGDFRRRNARRRAKRSQQPLGQVPQPTASYPYNVGYVQMTQMPTGLPGAGRPTPYQRQPVGYHPYLPASTPSSMPYSQSGASLSSPVSQYSYAMSMYPSPSPTGAPPNVNAAQISEFNGWIPGHSASQLTGSPTSLAPLSAMPSDYCNIPISSYGMYGYNC